jgi:hypothetical protein
MHFYVNGTGTASITVGAQLGTLTDNGTGDYTITFTYPGARLLAVCFSSITKVYHQLHSSTGKTLVRVLTFNDAGSATDADFYLEVTVSDSAYEY